ncbi:hypothetical protein [Actinomyces faecalis]|uniref:hypothetical protein n=1 Tax=Actinomyces faecalis TaxID=2722820 RepID=UPI001554AC1C|nr:hypothetical protein [Actinomyces faecalis]
MSTITESRTRYRARRCGLGLMKSRSHTPSDPRYGSYWLLDLAIDGIVAGGQWGLNLESINAFLDDYEALVAA